jgi:DNA-binding transcriptional MerR regulator
MTKCLREAQMITTKDILKQTGLKNARTLARWYQKGLIPKPMVGPHPSGRGRISYWPDWVLNRCLKIVELRKKGYSLDALRINVVADSYDIEKYRPIEKPTVGDIAKNKPLKLADGTEIRPVTIFQLMISEKIKSLVTDRDLVRTITEKLKEKDILKKAIELLASRCNPVLIFDGEDIDIQTDFLISHRFIQDEHENTAYLTIPLLPYVRKIFEQLKLDFPFKLNTQTEPIIQAQRGHELSE